MRVRNVRRRAIALIVLTTTLSLALGTALAPAASALGHRGKLLKMLNVVRERHGLRELRIDPSFSRDAVRHVRAMVRANRVYDPPNLDTFLSDEPWQQIGASISGCAGSLRGLHRAWMRHHSHRVIMLEPRLRRVGIGVIENFSANSCGRGSFWGAELFYG
jgi:uncharacterized protein YkwD